MELNNENQNKTKPTLGKVEPNSKNTKISKRKSAQKKKKRKKHNLRFYEYDDNYILTIDKKGVAKEYSTIKEALSANPTANQSIYDFPCGITHYAKNQMIDAKITKKLIHKLLPEFSELSDSPSTNRVLGFIDIFAPIFFGALSGSLARMIYELGLERIPRTASRAPIYQIHSDPEIIK